jgi:hypothetical protein
MSEEIRQRLEKSLSFADDKPTEAFIEALCGLLALLERKGRWHEDPLLFETFRSALDALLGIYCPEDPRTIKLREVAA